MDKSTYCKAVGTKGTSWKRVGAMFTVLALLAAIAVFAFDGYYQEYGVEYTPQAYYIYEWNDGYTYDIAYEYGYYEYDTICAPPPRSK